MPCLNEEKSLRTAALAAHQDLRDAGVTGELIIVNDGSVDATHEIGVELERELANVIYKRNDTNLGIGGAYWEGCKLASHDYVVMIPGDNENSVRQVLKYLDLVDRVDIVIPFVQNQEIRDRYRRLISGTYRWIINLSFGTTLNYTNGTVIYNRHALASVELAAYGFFYQTELLVKLLRKGFLYAEVPLVLSKRDGGRSTALSFRSLTALMRSFGRFFFDVHVRRIEGARVPPHLLPEGTVTRRLLMEDSS